METENVIIINYARFISDNASTIISNASMLTDSEAENKAIIATLNVNLESLRSLTVLLQSALDNYK